MGDVVVSIDGVPCRTAPEAAKSLREAEGEVCSPHPPLHPPPPLHPASAHPFPLPSLPPASAARLCSPPLQPASAARLSPLQVELRLLSSVPRMQSLEPVQQAAATPRRSPGPSPGPSPSPSPSPKQVAALASVRLKGGQKEYLCKWMPCARHYY